MSALPSPTPPDLRYLLLLVLLYGLFAWLYRWVPDATLATVVYRYGINEVAAFVINTLSGTPAVTVRDNQLFSPAASLEVVRGCDGSGVFFMMTAAVLAARVAWRRKLAGVALGFAAVYVINELRLVALYFVLRARPQWFELLHLYLIPIASIVAVALVFASWLRWAAQDGAGRHAT